MRAMAGGITSKAGAYLCACCKRRVVMTVGCLFERCKSCDGSLFAIDWRNWATDDVLTAGPDLFGDTAANDGADETHFRQWSML